MFDGRRRSGKREQGRREDKCKEVGGVYSSSQAYHFFHLVCKTAVVWVLQLVEEELEGGGGGGEGILALGCTYTISQ